MGHGQSMDFGACNRVSTSLWAAVTALPRNLEDAQQSQGPQHTDSKRGTLFEFWPDHLKDAANYNLGGIGHTLLPTPLLVQRGLLKEVWPKYC